MSTTEQVRRLLPSEFPFAYLKEQWQALEDSEEVGHLLVLGLSPWCDAEEVRMQARDLRTDLQQKGDSDTVIQERKEAIKWALLKTGDCLSDREYSLYFQFNWRFEEIALGRNH